MKKENSLAIFQAKDGSIELKIDNEKETLWGTRMQMSKIFGVNPQAISKHLNNIFKEGELDKKTTSSKMELIQNESGRMVKRKIDFYTIDAIISVGYRINSQQGTKFRIWATKTLKKHITQGYTINEKILNKKKNLYEKVLSDIQLLSEKNNKIDNSQIINLIKSFSSTWFALESYDKQNFPTKGEQKTMQEIDFQNLSKKLYEEISVLKKELIQKKEATDLFAQEKNKGSLEGIVGNVFQSVFGQDAYETTEEKAVHLLYFIIKNHPFNDGNKRTGAFSFIWILQKLNFDFIQKISPETLTILTLLIAESNPKEKDKMVGLVLLLLK